MPDLNDQLNTVHFKITTGDDDLRSDSEAIGTVIVRQGNQVNQFSKSLNDKARWADRTTHESDILLPDIQVKDLQGIRITFSSGSCFLCANDEWKMDAVEVTYAKSSGGDEQLVNQWDRPIKHFTVESPNWDYPFSW